MSAEAELAGAAVEAALLGELHPVASKASDAIMAIALSTLILTSVS
ncbi:hypothetical protein [Cryobacterium algoritolerans]|nr:hypothetical protein [Cryobacterium algoritolerans]